MALAYLKDKDAESEAAHGTCEQQHGPCCMTLRSATLLGDRERNEDDARGLSS